MECKLSLKREIQLHTNLKHIILRDQPLNDNLKSCSKADFGNRTGQI